MGVGGGASGIDVEVGRGPLEVAEGPVVGVVGDVGEVGDEVDLGDAGSDESSFTSSSHESATTGAAFAFAFALDDEGAGSSVSLERAAAASRDFGDMMLSCRLARYSRESPPQWPGRFWHLK